MTARSNAARLLGALFCGALASGALVVPAQAAAEESAPAADVAAAQNDDAASLRDAVALMARHFQFSVVGANRLGTDTPSWPADELAPEAMLGTLLKNYSYMVLLKPETHAGAARELQTVFIVGPNKAPAETAPTAPAAAAPMMPRVASAAPAPSPAAASGHRPSWAPPPSTVVRALTKLATTNGPNGDEAAQPTVPMPNPAENAAAMAALTRSAQSGLGALVTGLRQACPNPKGC
jgi:hypothetical protein